MELKPKQCAQVLFSVNIFSSIIICFREIQTSVQSLTLNGYEMLIILQFVTVLPVSIQISGKTSSHQECLHSFSFFCFSTLCRSTVFSVQKLTRKGCSDTSVTAPAPQTLLSISLRCIKGLGSYLCSGMLQKCVALTTLCVTVNKDFSGQQSSAELEIYSEQFDLLHDVINLILQLYDDFFFAEWPRVAKIQ